MFESIKKSLGEQSDLFLVISVVAILGILFIPIPPQLLDFLLITNFSFALLILLLTFYVEKPLEFSTFPSLLLIITLFRLSLNIAATRLILSDADAGEVIGAIGTHCSGLIAPDTLIRDNYYQILRCHNESETNIQTVF